MKIYNRFKKLQRKRYNAPITNVSQTKGKTTKKRNSHCWTNVPEPCESEDLTAVVSKIKKEWQSAKKDHEKIQELMAACYGSKRSLVSEDRRIVEVVEMFPPLKNLLYIKAEFAKVIGNKDVATQVKENFNKVWRHRLLAYAEKNGGKHSEDLKRMHNAIDSGILEEGECAGRAAIKIAQIVFKQPNSRRTPHVKEAVIKVVKNGAFLDEKIRTQIQPCILVVDDLYQSDTIYVVAEGIFLCHVTTKKIGDALVALLATYYMYNIKYIEGMNVYSFLDMALLGIIPEKCPSSVKSLVGVL
ncbi:uncharacterized protein LOC124456974 [Xenia sp. Carnegie-2017]|uniref:uncharacterized protein LOC124456974 n=1 Tax=Xenia sp. Carnegie-2017 TaxID=2897299 RepID=UPI001F0489C7|nr:uncharacterized protein LOC124456974 [Xenia sp. Carnegie-2017]